MMFGRAPPRRVAAAGGRAWGGLGRSLAVELGTYIRMPGAATEDDRGDEGDRQQQDGEEGSGHEICIDGPLRDLRSPRVRLTAAPRRQEIAT
jgi:hypothetical protein